MRFLRSLLLSPFGVVGVGGAAAGADLGGVAATGADIRRTGADITAGLIGADIAGNQLHQNTKAPGRSSRSGVLYPLTVLNQGFSS